MLRPLHLIGRNLNSPTFDEFSNDFNGQPQVVEDEHIHPQFAAGIAFIPWTWLTVALEADLTKGQASINGYNTPRVEAGLEINPWNVLALRTGLYKNVAESDIGPVITVGAGLNLWALRIDLRSLPPRKMTTLSGYNVPNEFRASLALGVDF